MPESHLPAQPKKRCAIYVDAFNWYFGVFQHYPAWKWLNVQSFFERLRLDEEVLTVKFFTALVEPMKHVSARRDRQKRYLKALGTLPKVKIILGKYQERTVTCNARDCMRRLEYTVPEEKKTDVNIAVNLLQDAVRAQTDSMVIVSGDSDLEPAVEWVRGNYSHIKTLCIFLSWRMNDSSAAMIIINAWECPARPFRSSISQGGLDLWMEQTLDLLAGRQRCV